MKENTIFHFGTSERKYSCFSKKVAVGIQSAREKAVFDEASGKSRIVKLPAKQRCKRERLFLRRTIAGINRSQVQRIPKEVAARYDAGFADLAEAMAWADSLFEAPKRIFEVAFEGRPHE